MEIVTEPELHWPKISSTSEYVDSTVFLIGSHGIKCPCNLQKDKLYSSKASFVGHIKTKTHQNWLDQLNANRANFYVENERLKKRCKTSD